MVPVFKFRDSINHGYTNAEDRSMVDISRRDNSGCLIACLPENNYVYLGIDHGSEASIEEMN